jgi:hypothetical protein
MSWVITGAQPFPAVIGEAFGGGYFAGYISHTADENATHALIVASRQQIGGKYAVSGGSYTGSTTSLAWASGAAATNSVTTGVGAGQILTDYNNRKDFDGAVNIAIMKANTYGLSAATYPAAYFIDNINAAGGFNGQTDWYLPSRFELDIAYFNLKPTTDANNSSWGINAYSVPKRTQNNTSGYPGITSVSVFAASTEQFVQGSHWSSTEIGVGVPRGLDFAFGNQFNDISSNLYRVRAFRKIAL